MEADSGAGITKEVPSKIHELHADAAELTPEIVCSPHLKGFTSVRW